MERRLISEMEAAKYLGVSRPFLAKSRMDGQRKNHTPGPPYIKLGRAVRYDIRDLDEWIELHRREVARFPNRSW